MLTLCNDREFEIQDKKNIGISSSEVIRLEIMRQSLILHMIKHLVGVDLDQKRLTLR